MYALNQLVWPQVGVNPTSSLFNCLCRWGTVAPWMVRDSGVGTGVAPLVRYANRTMNRTRLAHRAVEASEKLRIMLRRLRFGKTVLLSSVAPVNGEVSLVRNHSKMAVRS